MTWTWTLTRIGISTILGAISSNPVGWAVGVPTATLLRLKSESELNSSTLTLSDKVSAQRLIEVSTDYQWGCGFGIIGKGLGVIASEIANETLVIGKSASREIAVNGFKTELARSLISNGQFLSKIETIIKRIPDLQELEERIKALFNIIKEISKASNEKEFIEGATILIQAQSLFINEIENELNEKRKFLNSVRKNILEINKKNVEFFIKHKKNKEDHRKINREINTMLVIIKGMQKGLHDDNNCCEECRFCET